MLEQLVAAALACVAIDGDTIKCGNETVRLQNIDAAEMHGRCTFETDLAQRAKSFTARRLTEGEIEIVVDRSHPRDRHSRTIAWVKIGDRDLGDRIVSRSSSIFAFRR